MTPRLFAPEVVQTSAMDCGPAALKCILNGFGVDASYGRLREACQTDVDGTSIDTLEDLANAAGLDAEQILLPVDHVTLSSGDVLPAIAVVRQPGGLLHFVVAWRRHGRFVQVMDPATGRRWLTRQRFQDELFTHTMPLPANAWRQWAGSDLFHDGLRRRADSCGIGRTTIDSAIEEASRDSTWQSFSSLDATLRMTSALRSSGAVSRSDAARVLSTVWARARNDAQPLAIVPEDYWTVRPADAAGGQEHVSVRGAVLVRVKGVREQADRDRREAALPREIVAALREAPVNPLRHLLALLRADGIFVPAGLLAALLVAAAGIVVEALLLRSLIDLGSHLTLSGQRLAAMAALIGLSALLLLLELPIARQIVGMGRRLESRLRIAFLDKIPRLADKYVQSRPSSDMAERCHSAHQIRELPTLGARLVRATFELLLTTLFIAILYPASALLAVAAAGAALAIPLIAQPVLNERDLRQRTHTGALTRFYLDAFLGLVAIRAHGAERALAREQESLLVEWAGAGRSLLGAAVATSAAQLTIGFGMAIWILLAHFGRGDEGAGALLLAYWTLNIPVLAQEIAQIAWQYPAQRNLTLRLLEPLGALEEEPGSAASAVLPQPSATSRGIAIDVREVSVRAAGHTLLEDVSLTIPAGSHIAIVGASGAGKSTLAGLLLGWHRPSSGSLCVDGTALESGGIERLRQQTVWVDPAVQLWNRSLVANLQFGTADERAAPLGTRVAEADLRTLIERLPEGMQTMLGEGGALVSGGEGQRVRFGRGLGRASARLVILDEPFRGLERERRSRFLRRARERWPAATLLCITHDIADTAAFDRVLVVDGGRIVEDGDPRLLAVRPDSRYHGLLAAEAALGRRLWSDSSWRTLRLQSGRIVDDCERDEPVTV